MLLEKRTAQWRAELTGRVAVEGGAAVLGTALSVLAAAAVIDRLWLLPQEIRLGAFGLAVGLGAVAAWKNVWRPLRAVDPLDAAGRRFPELRHYLRPAWELKRSVPGHTSAALAEAHVERTEALLADLPGVALDPSPYRRGWAVLALVSLPLLTPRVLAPWRDVPLERYVTVTPGTAAVDWGRPVEIRARWLERKPGALKLWIDGRPAPWSSVSEDGGAVFVTAPVSQPLRYRLSWRDLRGQEHVLTPAAPPQLESPRVMVEGRAEEPLSAAEPVKARRGAWVTVSGAPNQPLTSALLKASFLVAPVALKERADGRWEAGFFAHESGSFRLELEAADGRRDPEPVDYRLEAKANEAPTIDLLSPAQPVQASPDDVVPVAWSARDDSGLSRVALVYGSKEVLVATPKKADALGEHPWDLSGLAPGTRLEFRLKAVDDDRSPLVGMSAPGLIEIVDFKGRHAGVSERVEKAREQLGALAKKHERLAKQSDAAAEASLPQDWRQAVEHLRELAKAMESDPFTNAGVREQTQALTEELAAAKDLKQHERRAKQLRKAERLLGESKALQTLQDFHHQAGRMEQSNAEMNAALASKDTEKLQKALGKLQRQMEELRKAIEALPKPPAGSAEAQNRQAVAVPLLQMQTTADAIQAAVRNGDFELAAKLAEELTRNLQKMQNAVQQAAAQAAANAPRPSQRMQKAEAAWNHVVEQQRRLLEASQRIEEARRQKLLEKQKALLAELAAEQRVINSSAAAAGVSPDAQEAMKESLREFEAGKVAKAPALLRGALPRLTPGLREREEAVLKKLENAPSRSEPDPDDAQTTGLAPKQGEVRGRTGELEGQLRELEDEVGTMPPGALDKLGEAQREQRAAEEALSRGDSAAAAERQEKALSLLEQGGDEMSQGAQRQQSVEQGLSRPAPGPGGMRPGGPRSSSGADTGFVPLPSASDYRPPRELREELERSQREQRPEPMAPVIKEYFRRLVE